MGAVTRATPAVVIAAPASGSGKTTVATGLMGALRRAGRAVAPFKVGPDYIDPGYHALASLRPGRNLDPVLMGEHLIGPLFRHGSARADIAVIEGVMGLFDGRITEESRGNAFGSTAHVAALLGAPVVMVVDARGQSHSIAALLHGFSTFDTSVRVAGVILNRVGSPRHEEVLRQACEHAGIPVLGAIPRCDEMSVPSRHLGLVTAVEHGDRAREAVEAMTALVGRHVDLGGIAALADSRVMDDPWDAEEVTPVGGNAMVALASGRAFSFGYAEHREVLTAAGAEVVEFDPLTDALPSGADALVVPGGFPEEFVAELSANDVARTQIRRLAASGAPVHAECAGLTYLVDDLDGHPMCGVISGSATFTDRLTLGYREAVVVADSPLHSIGDRMMGHEFHRTAVTFKDDYAPAWIFTGQAAGRRRDGVVDGAVHAGYLHTHPAAHPRAISRFVAVAATSKLAPMSSREQDPDQ